MALDVPDGWGLEGKVAVVTGAGAVGDGIGNGRAAAILLARAGARIVAVDRDGALAKRTAEMVGEAGGEAVAVEGDVTRATDCGAMVEAALDRFGRSTSSTTTWVSAAAARSSTRPRRAGAG